MKIENNNQTPIQECYFVPSKQTASATICANCGKEKYIHTIGEGIESMIIVKEWAYTINFKYQK